MTTLRRHSFGTAVLGLVLLLGSASAVSAQNGEITGTVYDESDSSTVDGLWVELYDEYGNHLTSVQTNTGSGVYAFTGLADGVYFVRATSDPAPGRDLVGEWYQDVNEYDFDLATRLEISGGNTLTGIDFHLARGSSISGQLFGLGGSEEIDLSVYDAASGRHRGGTRSGLGPYTINSLPPSSYKLFAEPTGTDRAFQWWDGKVSYNEADIIPVAENVDVTGKDFTLTAGTSISGTVTLDPDPGDGGTTLQQILMEVFDSATHEHLNSTNVDTNGTYGFTNLPPGSYLLQAQSDNTEYVQEMWVTGADILGQPPVFNHHEAEPITTEVGGPATGKNFLLEEGRSISGTVYLDGVGIEGTSVNADLVDGGYGRGAGTDPSGDYTVLGLAPGQYHVRVESGSVDEPFTAQVWQDKSLYEDPDPVDVSVEDASLINFLVSRDRLISGKVFLDPNNDQVQQFDEPGFSNITVRAFDFATGHWLGHAAVAPDGQYSIGVPAGVFQIEASPHYPDLLREAWEDAYAGNDATPVDVQTTDAAGIDFGIVSGEYFGTLRGRVTTGGTTTGIPGVDVQVWRYDDDQHIQSGPTDSHGYFTVSNLPPDSYRVLFDTGGRNAAIDTDFVPSFWSSTGLAGDPNPANHRIDYPGVLGDGTDLGAFELVTGGSISGTVFPPSGDSLPLPFNVNPEYAFGGGLPLSGAAVESDGSYHLRGLPEGPFRVHASTWGTGFVSVYYLTPGESTWHWNDATAVEVELGVQTTGIDLHLIRGGSISGLVTFAGTSDPLPGIQINVNLVDDPQGRGYWDGVGTEADGTYILQGLPAGNYRVRTDDRSGNYANQIYPTDVTVTEPFETSGIDFDLTSPATIGGRVYEDTNVNETYDAGEERAGVYLQAQEWFTGEWFGDAVSDSDGLYEIRGLGAGEYQVWLEPNETNFVRMSWNNSFDSVSPVQITETGGVPVDVGGIDFRVVQGFEISGFVYWDADANGAYDAGEKPVNNAWIHTDNVDGPHNAWGGTNPDGTYTLHGIHPGRYHVRAGSQNLIMEYWQEAYYSENATEIVVTSGTVTGIDFSLVDGPTIGTLRGRVIVDGTTDGISGVDVQVWRYDNDQHYRSGQTDIDGYFTVTNLPPGSYKVLFETGSRNAANDTDVVPSFWSSTGVAGDPDPVNHRIDYPGVPGDGTDLGAFELVTGGSISGKVSSPEGVSLPLPFSVYTEYLVGGGLPLSGAAVESDGTYHLRGLPEGAFRVLASTWGTGFMSVYYLTPSESTWHQNDAVAVEVEVGVKTTGIDLHLLRGGSISGQVTFAGTGDPLPGIQINVNLVDDPQGRGYGDSINTAADGTYLVQGLPTGGYRVRTDDRSGNYANQIYPTDISVTEPFETPDIDFVLTAPATISGRVYEDTNGDGSYDAGEERAGVYLQAQEWATGEWFGDTVSDDNGVYEIQSLGVGTYQVCIEPNETNFVRMCWDNSFESSTPVEITGGSVPLDVTEIDFRVVQGFEIRGFVFWDADDDGVQDAGELAVNNAWISTESVDGTYNYWNGTSSDGTYTVHGIYPSRYYVQSGSQNLVAEYWQDSYYREDATEIDVTSGTATNIDISLIDWAALGTLRGRVVIKETTEGIPGVDVQLLQFEDDQHIASVTTDGFGYFVFDNIQPSPASGYKIYFDTSLSNVGNDKDYVSSYWAEIAPPGEIDPNLMRIDFPSVPDPASGPGTDLGEFGLAIGGSISGVVYPPDGGTSIAGTNVWAQSFESGGQPVPGVTVDGSGVYRLRGLPAQATYRVQADASNTDLVSVYYWSITESTFDHGTATAVEVRVDTEEIDINLYLLLGGTISGTVTAQSSGLPVSDFPVSAGLTNDPLGRGFGGGASTAADGTYTINALVPGDYSVWTDARSGAYANQTHPDLHQVVEGVDTSPVDFELVAGGRIIGRVTQLVGGIIEPVVNIRVEASEYVAGEIWSDGYTDADGYYSIGALAQGHDYRVQVQPWAHSDPQFFNFISEFYDDELFHELATPVSLPVGAGVTEVSGIDFEIALGGAISGIVTAGGAPVQNVHVSADLYNGAPWGNGDNTDHNGFYIIRGLLPEDTYRVHASAWPQPYVSEYFDDTTDWSLATPVSVQEVVEGEPLPITGAIDFDLGPAYAISGRVTEADGTTPIPNIQVNASGIDVSSGGQASTDVNGDYAINSLEPGTYDVAAETWGTDFIRQQQEIDLGTGDVSGVDFALQVGAVISGRVYVDADASGGYDPGEEREGVSVSASDFYSGEYFGNGQTDTEGLYEVRGLGAGSYMLSLDQGEHNLVQMVYPDDIGEGGAQPVEVVDGGGGPEDVTGIDFLAIQGYEISGLVFYDANNDGIQQPAEPGIANLSINAELQGLFWGHVWTGSDNDGSYTLHSVYPGSHTVSAHAGGTPYASELFKLVGGSPIGTFNVSEADHVDVSTGNATGIDLSLTLGGGIAGTVRDAATTLPLGSIDLWVGRLDGDGLWWGARTDSNGDYLVDGLSPEQYVVQAYDQQEVYVYEFHQDTLFQEDALPVFVVARSSIQDPLATPVDFYLDKGGAIEGVVYHDANLNGFRDAGEPGIPGVSVDVEEFADPRRYLGGTSTQADGTFSIGSLPSGLDLRISVNTWPANFLGGFYDGGSDSPAPDWTQAIPLSVSAGTTIAGIDFGLGSSYTISGRVTEADGTTPIPDIEVYANGIDVSSGGQVSTDANGDYINQGLEPGTYEVAAETWGTDFIRQQQEVDLSAGDVGGVDFALQVGAVISGRVYVDDDGDGAFDAGEEREGVWIHTFDSNTGQYFASELSDAAGLYEIRGLGVGSYRLRLGGGEHNLVVMYYEQVFSWGDAQPVEVTEIGGAPQDVSNIDFRAIQGSEIRGVVFYDANDDGIQQPGEPGVPDISINTQFQGSFWVRDVWTGSDTDGSYTLHGVYPGPHTVSAHAGGTPYASELYRLVGGLPVGTFNVSEADHVDASAGDATGIDLSLVLGGGIAGTVRDAATTNPIGSIDLYVNRYDGDGLWWGATTDSNGNYVVDGLSPGGYVIQAWDNQEIYVSEFHQDDLFGDNPTQVSVVARGSVNDPLATTVDFDLDKGGAIEGVVYHDANGNGVRDAGEAGLAGLQVHLEESANPHRYLRGGSTESDGSFRVSGLPPDLEMRIHVNTWPTDFLWGFYDGGDDSTTTDESQASPVTVGAGATTPGIDFGLSEGGTITGVVVDGDGVPIPGMYVDASSDDWGAGDNTDDQGRYTLPGLVPGDYQVSTGGDPYRQEWYDNQTDGSAPDLVAVAAGVTTSGIDFVLPVLPRIISGPTPSAGERGSTVTGVTVTVDHLTAGATISLGADLTITGLNRSDDTFTFDVVIAANLPLGGRSLTVVNDQLLEDGAATLTNAFQVVPGTGDVPAPSATRLYVTDGGRGQLRVYGTADNSLLGTIDICCNPVGIALSPDGSLAYVNGGDGRTSVIDTRLGDVGKEVAWFTLYGNSGSEAMATTATHLYAVDRSTGLNQVWVVDQATWEVVSTLALGAQPDGLGIDPTGQTMYVIHTNSNLVSVVDLNSADPTLPQVLTTVAIPGDIHPWAVNFTADGSRAYIGGWYDTYVIDTALALSDPANAVVAYLPDLAAPFNIAQHSASGKELAYFESQGRVAVVDITPPVTEPETLRFIEAGVGLSGFHATADQLFLTYSRSLDLWVVDMDELFTSTTLSLIRFDGPEAVDGLGIPVGGLAVGATPTGPPAAAPSITAISGPVETGTPFVLTIDGSNFDPGAIVWLQGTPDRGTVTSATSTELVVEFPSTTPGGDVPVVVTNPVPGGGASTVSFQLAEVLQPASYTPTQTLFVTSYGEGKIEVYNPDGSTATIQTMPRATTMAVTPDGNLGFVGHNFYGPWASWDATPEHYFDMAAVDLDPASPKYLENLAYMPRMRSSTNSPAVTPNLDNPNGVFIYVPDYVMSDTVAVVDPATLAEVDTIELDGNIYDRNLRPNDVALTPDGTLLYTANIRGNSVSIVDAVTRQVVGELTNGGDLAQPQNVAITPTDTGAGVFVYVLARNTADDPFLFIFEAGNTNDSTAKIDQIPLPLYPRAMAISQDGETVYVAANVGYPDSRSEVYVVDVRPSERAIVDQIDLPDRVYTLIEAPDDQLLYLTGFWNSSVFVVDLAPGAGYPLITTLKAPGCPMDAAVEPSAGIVHPVVVAVTPNSGSPAGGDPVVITGVNFAAGVSVEFGAGNTATDIVVAGNYAIEALTPASGLPGNVITTVDVTVRNADGKSHTLFDAFTYELETIPPVFTTPPYVASQVLVGDPPSATVEIRWRTDDASTSTVDYREIVEPTFVQQISSVLTTDHLITVTGLAPATNYEFRATSADSNGNEASSPLEPDTVPFTTPTAPDTTPPEIGSTPTVSTTVHEALIQWTTDEEATTVVQYDAQLGDGHQDRQEFGAGGTFHSVNLTGLEAHTEYEFRVLSVDASGNGPTSSEVATFTTDFLEDETPPVITSGPTPTYLANDLVIVQWQTDEPSTSFINYGTSTILEQGVVDIDLVTNHVVFLTNLLPGTAYGYQVGSTDPSGNTVLSIDPFAKTLQTLGTSRLAGDLKAGIVTLKAGAYLTKAAATDGFTTPEIPDTTAPTVLSVTVTPSSFDRVFLTVATDEDASLRVHFGVGSLTDSTFDPAFGQRSSLLLTGLTGSTIYQLSVEVTDPKGNTTTDVQPTFKTPAEPDAQAPTLLGLTIDPVTDTTALLTWTTDEPADATVHFGVQGGPLDRQVGRLGLATTHEILLTGLTPATTYDAEVASRDASDNVGTATTSFTTTAPAPTISSVNPSSAVQGSMVEVAVNGTHLDNALVELGAGVTVGGVTINDSGTQVRVQITVDPSATVGPRQLVVTTGYGSATATFSIVDESVPVVEILSPLNGADLTSLTVAVHGTVSEHVDVTVNGVAANVHSGSPITFDATVTLAGAGLRGITASAIDPSGNLGTDTVTVLVTNQPPVAVCQDATISAAAGCQAAVTPADINGGSADPDGNPLTMSVYPGLLSGLGSHSVTLTVDDDEMQDSCTSTVTVVDTTGPTIEAITADPPVLWPPNHKMKKVTVAVLASDACDVEPPACLITNVTSNEPETGCDKKGDKGPDWEITGDLSLELRAERCGTGDGRVYTIEVTCSDNVGNTSQTMTYVSVPHEMVTIKEATYKTDKEEFKVKATSSEEPDAVLTVVGYGEMTRKKKDYELTIKPMPRIEVPDTVTVESSLGASATAPIELSPKPPEQAGEPEPGDGATDVRTNTILEWKAGKHAKSHDVYIGTNPSPGAGDYQGNQSDRSFVPGVLAASTTYYWRIDEVNTTATTAGAVWSFTTGTGPVDDVVTITKAEWKEKSEELKVEATSSDQPHASLTLVGLGPMTFDKGKYKFKDKPQSNPGTVTVTSDRGGTHTATVKVK